MTRLLRNGTLIRAIIALAVHAAGGVRADDLPDGGDGVESPVQIVIEDPRPEEVLVDPLDGEDWAALSSGPGEPADGRRATWDAYPDEPAGCGGPWGWCSLGHLLCCRQCRGGRWGVKDFFRHSSVDPRHIGKGRPLMGTSWLNRPFHADWFAGALFGDNLIGGRVDQGNDLFGGYRLGWDMDHYWGGEVRFGWSAPELVGPQDQPLGQTGDVFVGDINLLYYPWGDARWRPYLLMGAGVANFSFMDENGVHYDTTLVGMPVGGGLKYALRQWLALRAELLDNMAFGNHGIEAQHNVSLTLGVEVHWGAITRSYWPWNPGRHVW